MLSTPIGSRSFAPFFFLLRLIVERNKRKKKRKNKKKMNSYKYFTTEHANHHTVRRTEIEKYFIERASSSRWPMLEARPSLEIL